MSITVGMNALTFAFTGAVQGVDTILGRDSLLLDRGAHVVKPPADARIVGFTTSTQVKTSGLTE